MIMTIRGAIVEKGSNPGFKGRRALKSNEALPIGDQHPKNTYSFFSKTIQ
jgi:hypothetical protein